ncbi:unnamed protein product [Miscanthus lutarioriparius]|uniref:Uncharacterized protein n=1 Tax=Miscanthus lutarioriparius TaxID=422564 RepID=A0A811NAB0_9POAL|nr:unnamed protein product [Miscanthus lutarioriparius]
MQVMDTIKSTEGKHLEVLIGLASQICNVQGIQLDIHDREAIVDKMVGALKGNMIPNPEYPRMRRVTIEMAISITKLCSSYATILREKGMIDLMSKIERLPPSKVEKYRIFFGNVGVVSESGVPLPDLVANAKHLIDPAPGPQPGGHA